MPVTETRVIQKPNGELTVSVIGEAKPKKGTSASVIINLEEINLLLLNTKDHTGPVSMVRDGNEIRTVANERHPTQISLGKVDASGKVTTVAETKVEVHSLSVDAQACSKPTLSPL